MSKGLLDRLQSPLQGAKAEFDGYLADRNEGRLATIESHTDSILDQLSSLPQLPFRVEEEQAAKAARDYAETVADLESRIREKLSAVLHEAENAEETLATLREEIEKVEQTVSVKTGDAVSQVEAKLGEVRAEVESQKGRLDDAVSRTETTFAETQQRNIQTFADNQEMRQNEFQTRMAELVAEAKERLLTLTEEANTIVARLTEHEENAARIVGVAAAAGVAGGYDKEAGEQKEQADRFRYLAVLIGFALLGGAVAALIFGLPDDTSLEELATFAGLRLPIGAALIGLFAYAIRESAQHRARESRARHRAMELTAFRPFLAELSDSDLQAEIKEGVRRFFPGEAEVPNADDS